MNNLKTMLWDAVIEVRCRVASGKHRILYIGCVQNQNTAETLSKTLAG
jgi:hypothetical protein